MSGAWWRDRREAGLPAFYSHVRQIMAVQTPRSTMKVQCFTIETEKYVMISEGNTELHGVGGVNTIQGEKSYRLYNL